MDAVVYCKTLLRMCKSHPACCGCTLKSKYGCIAILFGDMEKAVPIVEQWSKDHPVKTRKTEFLKMFPDANMNGIEKTWCVAQFDKNIKCDQNHCGGYYCEVCKRKFWNEEVSE